MVRARGFKSPVSQADRSGRGIHSYIHTYTYTYIQAHPHTLHTCTQTYIHIHTYTHTHVHTDTHYTHAHTISTQAYKHTNKHVICPSVCLYVGTSVDICLRTSMCPMACALVCARPQRLKWITMGIRKAPAHPQTIKVDHHGHS